MVFSLDPSCLDSFIGSKKRLISVSKFPSAAACRVDHIISCLSCSSRTTRGQKVNQLWSHGRRCPVLMIFEPQAKSFRLDLEECSYNQNPDLQALITFLWTEDAYQSTAISFPTATEMVDLQSTDLLLLLGKRRISSCSCNRSEIPPTADRGILLEQNLEAQSGKWEKKQQQQQQLGTKLPETDQMEMVAAASGPSAPCN